MAKETAQQKRDREFLALLEGQLAEQKAALVAEHTELLNAELVKAKTEGWHRGHRFAIKQFDELSFWDRLTWKGQA